MKFFTFWINLCIRGPTVFLIFLVLATTSFAIAGLIALVDPGGGVLPALALIPILAVCERSGGNPLSYGTTNTANMRSTKGGHAALRGMSARASARSRTSLSTANHSTTIGTVIRA